MGSSETSTQGLGKIDGDELKALQSLQIWGIWALGICGLRLPVKSREYMCEYDIENLTLELGTYVLFLI